MGLIPFAVKLPADLVNEMRELAAVRKEDMAMVVADLLKRGLQDCSDN